MKQCQPSSTIRPRSYPKPTREQTQTWMSTAASTRSWLNEAHEGLKKGSSNQHNSRKSRKQHRRKKWWELKKWILWDSNPRPPDLKADALTTEPSVQLAACNVMTSRLSISSRSQKCQNLRRMIVARDCHNCHNVAPQSPPFGPTLMLSLSVHPMGLP